MRTFLLAHGSSDARHRAEAEMLAERVGAFTGEVVELAFLQAAQPPAGSRVMPLFLGEGQHATVDLPALAKRFGWQVLPGLSAHAEQIAEIAYRRVTAEGRRINAMFGLYRFIGFEALYAALHARNNRCTRVAHAALHGEPSLASVLRLWRQEGHVPVRLQPMLLFSGNSLEAMRRQVAGENVELLPPLAHDQELASLVAGALKQAA